MDEIKRIGQEQIEELVAKLNFDRDLMIKDYFITVILYLIKDVKGIYFKGGTGLHKIFLNYARLSEDIDLTLTRDIDDVSKEILERLDMSRLFNKIVRDKDVDGFRRLVVYYKGFLNQEGVVFIDINKRAKLVMKPEVHKINHFYKGNIPAFSFNTVAKEEMIAGKIMAAMGRNKPRDHYDIYEIIKAKLPINLDLVKKKSKLSKQEFSIIKMFNKAKKLKNRWDDDMAPLVGEKITFQEVMQTLAKHFKLKEEKEKIKDSKLRL